MKKFNIILFALGVSISVQSQNWVDQQYSYDSVLNVAYGSAVDFNGNNVNLYMDIYSPQCPNPNQTSRWPLMVVIHGGAFIAGSKNDASVQDYCKEFARRGYVTASISYRLGFISDENAWSCNYPNYPCLFASDSAEWFRAYYRGIQDGKGALRYLMNRNQTYAIDTNNVFLVGESAGAFIALGIGLMNDDSERPGSSYALNPLPAPHPNAMNCSHNAGETFSNSIPRPDLGGIEGDIEPSSVNFTIKGIGNIFGALMTDLLQLHPPNKVKPSIYSYHQPCDIIVPIDSKQVLWGLDWCMTNGYNCYAIANTPVVHGGQTISDWNNQNNYGYTIQNHFTANAFPYQYAFLQGSCLDQVNTPCHAYDNMNQRQLEIAQFFAPQISSSEICQTLSLQHEIVQFQLVPNPGNQQLEVIISDGLPTVVTLYTMNGVSVLSTEDKGPIDLRFLTQGMYLVELSRNNQRIGLARYIKR